MRFSSLGLWKSSISGCPSALIVSIENDSNWSAGRPAVGTLYAPADWLAGFVIGREEIGCRYDAKLLALSSATE